MSMRKSTYIWTALGTIVTTTIGIVAVFFPSLFDLERERLAKASIHLGQWEDVAKLDQFLGRNIGKLIELELTADPFRVISIYVDANAGERLDISGKEEWALQNAKTCPIMTVDYVGDNLQMVFNNRRLTASWGLAEELVALGIDVAQENCQANRPGDAFVVKLLVEDTSFDTVIYREQSDYEPDTGELSNRYFWVEGRTSWDSSELDHWHLVPVSERDVKFKRY